MKVNSVAKLRAVKNCARLLELALTGVPDDQIAEILTREGHHPPNCRGQGFADHSATPPALQRASRQKGAAQQMDTRTYFAQRRTTGRQARYSRQLIYVQIRRKRLLIDQQSTGAYLFQNSPAVVNAVRDLRNRTINHLDLRIIQPHQEGHQNA
ncbi:hypothetical protein ACOJBM_01425 [Rhizobium beringeri]